MRAPARGQTAFRVARRASRSPHWKSMAVHPSGGQAGWKGRVAPGGQQARKGRKPRSRFAPQSQQRRSPLIPGAFFASRAARPACPPRSPPGRSLLCKIFGRLNPSHPRRPRTRRSPPPPPSPSVHPVHPSRAGGRMDGTGCIRPGKTPPAARAGDRGRENPFLLLPGFAPFTRSQAACSRPSAWWRRQCGCRAG
jgi:hypothetical protein